MLYAEPSNILLTVKSKRCYNAMTKTKEEFESAQIYGPEGRRNSLACLYNPP
jgi:hypothetical protein